MTNTDQQTTTLDPNATSSQAATEEHMAAAAKAIADAAAKAAGPAPKTKRAARKRELDIDRLTALAAQVAAHEPVSLPVFMGFVDTLERNEGADIEDENGLVTVTLAGVTGRSMGGLRAAVVAWSNAARRAVLAAR